MKKESSVKVGNRYGKLVVTEILPAEKVLYPAGYTAYKYPVRCKCDCGNNDFITTKQLLKSGSTVTCGCRQHGHISIGDKFGHLTVIGDSIRDKKVTKWLVRCECGTEFRVADYALKSGNTKSCGCVNRVYDDVKPGDKYGMLTVINRHKNDESESGVYWDCKCDCGNETVVQDGKLKSGETKSCGCLVKKHHISVGDVFGYWTVLEDLGSGFYKCKCECGTIKTLTSHVLVCGLSTSCGCRYTDSRKTDQNIVRFLPTAASILQRTKNIHNYLYYNYGGRGIKCELGESRYDVAESLSKVPGYFEGAQIDRIDNNGNYTLFHPEHGFDVWLYHDPVLDKDFKAMGNLRWVTAKENVSNKHDIGDYIMTEDDFGSRLIHELYFKRLVNKNHFKAYDFVKFDTSFLSEFDVYIPGVYLYVHKSIISKADDFKNKIIKFYEINKDWKMPTMHERKIES